MSVEELAAGLTKAQRECLIDDLPDGFSIAGTGWLHRMRGLCLAGLARRTRWRIIGRGKLTHSAVYDITPLGLAVRSYLMENG